MKIFILYPSVGQREILNHRNVSIGRDHSFKIYPGDKFWPFSGLSVSKRGLYERSVVVAQGQMDSNYKRGDLDWIQGQKFLSTRMVRHENRLFRELAEAPSLETFKGRLDWALNNLIWS